MSPNWPLKAKTKPQKKLKIQKGLQRRPRYNSEYNSKIYIALSPNHPLGVYDGEV